MRSKKRLRKRIQGSASKPVITFINKVRTSADYGVSPDFLFQLREMDYRIFRLLNPQSL